METRNCLNCREPLAKKFCPNCGQKADTHRITLRHFVAHDLLHGVWHLEKGILFTIKETLVRPGKAALDYIGGKRIRYYNVFYLTLLVIGLNLVLNHLYAGVHPASGEIPDDSLAATRFVKDNVKYVLLGSIPVMAVSSWIVFRRLKLNLAEHFILAGISLLGMMLLCVLFFFFDFINDSYYTTFSGVMEVVTFAGVLFYPVWTCSNAVCRNYSIPGFLWRIVCFTLLFYGLLFLLLGLLLEWAGNGMIYLDM